jgi:hypothetical protein
VSSDPEAGGSLLYDGRRDQWYQARTLRERLPLSPKRRTAKQQIVRFASGGGASRMSVSRAKPRVSLRPIVRRANKCAIPIKVSA